MRKICCHKTSGSEKIQVTEMLTVLADGINIVSAMTHYVTITKHWSRCYLAARYLTSRWKLRFPQKPVLVVLYHISSFCWTWFSRYIYVYIQDISGGEVNILGGHIIGHSKQKKVYTYMCPIPNSFRDRAISLYSSKIVDKKEILHTVFNTSIYCSSDKVGTVYLV
jgi:hypothetical protein